MSGNRQTCDECGHDLFHVLMGIKASGKNLSDPRAQGFTDVVEQLECVECGGAQAP